MTNTPYTSFTLAKVKKEFGLTTVKAERFLPLIEAMAAPTSATYAPSYRLQVMLEDLPWAIAVILYCFDNAE